MKHAPRIALVIGASSGVGAACVKELSRRGYRVGAVARNEDGLRALAAEAAGAGGGEVSVWNHDVRWHDDTPAKFEEIVGELGGLGMIIYAAGIMPKITDETYDTEKDLAVLDVNLAGCISWLNCAAPYLKKQGAGSIVGISSIAGDRGRRGYPAYNTSKAAMNTYLEAVRNRISRHGVSVTTIKPGYVDTAMTKGMEGLFWVASPEQAARAVVDAGEKGRHTRYVFRRWGLVGLVIRSIPSFIFRKTNI